MKDRKNNKIFLKAKKPLKMKNNKIILKTMKPMKMKNNKIILKAMKPLKKKKSMMLLRKTTYWRVKVVSLAPFYQCSLENFTESKVLLLTI